MNDRALRRFLIPVLLAAVTIAIYLPTLGFGFVLDDSWQIRMNRSRFGWHDIPGYFTSDLWSYVLGIKSNYYRPIFLLWLMLNYQLFGLEPALWHTSVVATHVAAVLLLYLLARKLTGDAIAAGIAALLFAIHPVHVEAVAWISGVTESLFAVLAFGTILCYLRARGEANTKTRLWWACGAVALFTIAIFHKETAIVLPALLFAYEWLFPTLPSANRMERLRRTAWAMLPYGAVILFYLAARLAALGSFAPLTRSWPLSSLLMTWPFVLRFYIRQLFWPFQYSLFYPIGPVTHFGVESFVEPLLVVVIAAVVLWWLSRQSKLLAFCVLLLVIPLAPVMNLRAFAFDDFLHDRYLYLPSAGLFMLLALGLRKLGARLQAGILAPVALLCMALTIQASGPWKDDLSLFNRSTAVAPNSVIARWYFGDTLLQQRRYADALPLLRDVLARYLNDYTLYFKIGQCYVGLGQFDDAATYFRDAILLQPKSSVAYLYLGTAELHRGRLDDAEAHIRLALALRSAEPASLARYHYNLGLVLERKKDLNGALAEYEAELRETPDEELMDHVAALRVRGAPR